MLNNVTSFHKRNLRKFIECEGCCNSCDITVIGLNQYELMHIVCRFSMTMKSICNIMKIERICIYLSIGFKEYNFPDKNLCHRKDAAHSKRSYATLHYAISIMMLIQLNCRQTRVREYDLKNSTS